MRKTMSLKDYVELLKYIDENHGWRNTLGKEGSKHIKYVRCTFDTRTNTIFSVELDDKNFTIVNENKDVDLKEWIYEYLNS